MSFSFLRIADLVNLSTNVFYGQGFRLPFHDYRKLQDDEMDDITITKVKWQKCEKAIRRGFKLN